jgi:hypothetical protein
MIKVVLNKIKQSRNSWRNRGVNRLQATLVTTIIVLRFIAIIFREYDEYQMAGSPSGAFGFVYKYTDHFPKKCKLTGLNLETAEELHTTEMMS